MEVIKFILAILAALTALLVIIVIYKIGKKQKNINLIVEELQKSQGEDTKGGVESTAIASGLGAPETASAAPKSDQHFNPSC